MFGFVAVIAVVCIGMSKMGIGVDDVGSGNSASDAGNEISDLSIECEVNDAATVGLTADRLQSCIDAKEYAASKLSAEEFGCLEKMWNRESSWSAWAVNESSGTYGIPQIHPAVHGYPVDIGDWEGQVDWGLAYIERNHDTPCAAWEFWQRTDERCLPKAGDCANPFGEHWY
jgi:hypothetical protein